ncbi:MAG: hypothetical protein R6V46_18900 [Desulfatiglandaceae bacterium]
MKVSSAIARFFEYQKANCKKNTVRNYHFFLPKFEAQFGNRELNSLTTDEMWGFLTQQTDGTSQGTNREEHPRSQPPQSLRHARAQEDIQSSQTQAVGDPRQGRCR